MIYTSIVTHHYLITELLNTTQFHPSQTLFTRYLALITLFMHFSRQWSDKSVANKYILKMHWQDPSLISKVGKTRNTFCIAEPTKIVTEAANKCRFGI